MRCAPTMRVSHGLPTTHPRHVEILSALIVGPDLLAIWRFRPARVSSGGALPPVKVSTSRWIKEQHCISEMQDQASTEWAESPSTPSATSGPQRPGGGPRFGGQHILLPVEFSQRTWHALHVTMQLAEPLHARLSLLHVVAPVFGNSRTDPVRQSEQSMRLADARNRLDRLHTVIRCRGLDGEIVVSEGLPSEQITAVTRQLKADLLVLTTRGRTGLKRLLLGSEAELIARQAPSMVLMIRYGAFPERESGGLSSEQAGRNAQRV